MIFIKKIFALFIQISSVFFVELTWIFLTLTIEGKSHCVSESSEFLNSSVSWKYQSKLASKALKAFSDVIYIKVK